MTNPDDLAHHCFSTERDLPSEIREGDPVPHGQRPDTPRSTYDAITQDTDLAGEPTANTASAAGRTSGSCASPLPDTCGHPGGNGRTDDSGPTAGQPAGSPAPVLFTPGQAAGLLQVRESWLRRRAAQRLVPCTFLGKHLRFSRADLDQILADAARPLASSPRRGLSGGPSSHRPGQSHRTVRLTSTERRETHAFSRRLTTFRLHFFAHRASIWPCRVTGMAISTLTP
jgi:hypothetical protein